MNHREKFNFLLEYHGEPAFLTCLTSNYLKINKRIGAVMMGLFNLTMIKDFIASSWESEDHLEQNEVAKVADYALICCCLFTDWFLAQCSISFFKPMGIQ